MRSSDIGIVNDLNNQLVINRAFRSCGVNLEFKLDQENIWPNVDIPRAICRMGGNPTNMLTDGEWLAIYKYNINKTIKNRIYMAAVQCFIDWYDENLNGQAEYDEFDFKTRIGGQCEFLNDAEYCGALINLDAWRNCIGYDDVDYNGKSISERAGLITHELGHEIGNPLHCNNSNYCVMTKSPIEEMITEPICEKYRNPHFCKVCMDNVFLVSNRFSKNW